MSTIAEYDDWDATRMAELVAKKQVSPQELLTEAMARADARNPAINAVVLRQDDTARQMITAGLPQGPLHGVPFLLKDLGGRGGGFPLAQRIKAAGQHALPPLQRDLPTLSGGRIGYIWPDHFTRGRHWRGHRICGLWRANAQPLAF